MEITNQWIIPTIHNFDVKFKNCFVSIKVKVDVNLESFETSLNHVLEGSLTDSEIQEIITFVQKKIMDNEIVLPTLIQFESVDKVICENF